MRAAWESLRSDLDVKGLKVQSRHCNYVGVVERAERTPFIVAADRLARALGATLAEMLAEFERGAT